MKCSICKKYIWFWQSADYLEEGYGDAKAYCHNKCYKELKSKNEVKK